MKKILFIALVLSIYSCNSDSGDTIVSQANVKPLTLMDSLSDMIVNDPNNSNNYYRRALYLHNEKELEQAMADIDRALSIDSTVGEYYYEKGNIYYDDKIFKDAYASYQKAIEFDNEHVDAILQISKIEIALEDYKLALNMVNRALKIDPMNADGYFLKGIIYLNKGDTTNAISSYRTAVEVDPDHYNSYIMLGKLYATRNHEFAGIYYDNALKIRPNSIEALYDKSMFLQSIEQYDLAYPIYDRIIELDSSSYFAYYNKGYMLLITDSSYTGAIKEFEKSLVYFPYYYQALYNIGLSYENLGDYKLAEEFYKKSLDINPQYDLAARGLSRLLK